MTTEPTTASADTGADDRVIEITEQALATILELRENEAIPNLHLGLRISGVGPSGWLYETAFLRQEDVGDDDHIEYHGDLPVAIPADSVDDLRGAVLDLSSDPAVPGLAIRNPNPTPSTPAAGGGLHLPEFDLEGTVEERVRQLLDQAINPAIAAHGGVAHLVSVDGGTAYLELGGGCQGCGLAAMTLRQGIETAIKQHIPEITEVVDVTDHSAGVSPYYA